MVRTCIKEKVNRESNYKLWTKIKKYTPPSGWQDGRRNLRFSVASIITIITFMIMPMVPRLAGMRETPLNTCREILAFLMTDMCAMWNEGTTIIDWSLILSSIWTIVAKPFGPMSFWNVWIGCNTTPCMHGLPTWTVVGRMSTCHITTTTFGCNTHCFDQQNEKWNDGWVWAQNGIEYSFSSLNTPEVWRKTWKKSIEGDRW